MAQYTYIRLPQSQLNQLVAIRAAKQDTFYIVPTGEVYLGLKTGKVQLYVGAPVLPGTFILTSTEPILFSQLENALIPDLSPSPVGTYGSATQVGQFTVDIKGRITAAANVLITGVPPGGPAGGDLSGTYPNPTVAKINTVLLGSTVATDRNILIADGTQWVTQAASGDLTITANTGVFTLATVNANVGTWGSSTQAPVFTVNGKGLITAASNATITPAASSITGAQNVTVGSTKISLGGTPTGASLQAFSIDVVEANLTLNSIGGILSLAKGGTNANLTANNGGIFYSDAAGGAILAGTVTANKVLLSGSSSAPSWSAGTLVFSGAFTLTIPATGTAALGTGTNTLLAIWSGTNTISSDAGLALVSNTLTLSKSVNGLSSIIIENANGGTAAQARLTADNGTYLNVVSMLGSGFTTSGLNVANLAKNFTTSPVGFLFQSATASTKFWWTIGGNATTDEYLRLTTTGLGILTQGDPTVALDVNGGVAARQTTKTQITANQNNYAIGSGTSFRMSSDASRNVTGITGGFNGKFLLIYNIGSFNIVFTHEDGASTAANRMTMSTGGNITIAPSGSICLQYDTTSSRWRDFSVR